MVKESWRTQTLLRMAIWIPLLCLSLICSGWYIFQRIHDLERTQEEHAFNAAHQLLPITQYGLYNQDKNVLQHLADSAISNSDIRTVAFFNTAQEIIAYRGSKRLLNSTVISNQFDKLTHINKRDSETLNLVIPVAMPETDLNKGQTDFSTSDTDNLNTEKSQKLVGWLAVDFDTRNVILAEYHSLFAILMVILIGIIIASVAAKLLSRRLSNSLEDLCTTAREILTGTPISILEIHGTQEINAIHSCLLQMNYEVQKSEMAIQNQVQVATTDLQQQVDNLEMKNIKLEQAYKDSLHANQMKAEFIANMSHELRTPMNGILGFTNLLLENSQSSLQRQYLQTINESSVNLLAIINDILDFSKIEAGKLQLDYVPMDIRECIDEVMESLAYKAHDKNIELVPFIHATVPIKVLGDPLRIKQILNYLLSNAIRYTNNGSITVRVTAKSDQHNYVELQTEITDSSVGIPPDVHFQLLQAFTQGNMAISREYGETGLGLVIAQRLIRKMGGTIHVQSIPGRGATFSFAIKFDKITSIAGQFIEYKALVNHKILIYEPHPLTQESIKELFDLWQANCVIVDTKTSLISHLQQKSDLDLLLISSQHNSADCTYTLEILGQALKYYEGPVLIAINTNEQNFYHDFLAHGATGCIIKPLSYQNLYRAISSVLFPTQEAPVAERIEPKPALPGKQHLKVLAVDDNEPSLFLLKYMLEQLNCDVITGRDGEDAVYLSKKHKYDLIFLDIRLPKLSGIEASEQIRKPNQLNSNTPIIAVSAHLGPEEKAIMRDLGINEAILKPLNKTTLMRLIMKAAETQNSSPVQAEAKSKAPVTIHASPLPRAINWDLSVELAAGIEKVARELLIQFNNELPGDAEKVRTTFNADNKEALCHEVHRIHGACCYIGVPDLKQACKEFETALRNKSYDNLETLHENFHIAVDAVLRDYKANFQKNSEATAA